MGPIERYVDIEIELSMINEFSSGIDMHDIGLFWQLTLKTIDDLRIIGNENLLLEMYILQLIHLKQLDDQNKKINELENKEINQQNLIGKKIDEKPLEQNLTNQVKNQLKSVNQIKTKPNEYLSKQETNLKISIQAFKT